MPPSQLLRKFASYPRQHELALALREIGRIERTLFIIDWLLDADMQRRAHLATRIGAYPAHKRIQVEKSIAPSLKASFCTQPEQTPS